MDAVKVARHADAPYPASLMMTAANDPAPVAIDETPVAGVEDGGAVESAAVETAAVDTTDTAPAPATDKTEA